MRATGSRRSERRWILSMLAIFVALLAAIVLGASFGSVSIPFGDVLEVAFAGEAADVDRVYRDSLLISRFPRVLLLALVGGALAMCGAALQATFRNPMADPAILGVSGGGALGAVLAIYTGLAERSLLSLSLCAFAGALITALIVYFLAHVVARPSTSSLLLTGVAMSSLTSALVSLVLAWTEEYQLRNILFWLVGGAASRTWDHLELAAPPIILGAALLMAQFRNLDAMATGEEHAQSVGVSIMRARLYLLSVCALMSGAAVAVAGPVAFVGLMVPNGMRMLTGPRAKTLLPASFLGGAAFLVLCDLVSRSVSDRVEFPVGIVTALLGVPYFLFLLTRSRRWS